MSFRDIIQTAFHALRANTTRSRLTILGVVIGVVAIMMVASIGQSAEALILGQIETFGTKFIGIEPGRKPSGPSDFATFFTDSLTVRDLEDLQRPNLIPGITSVVPIVFGSYTMEADNTSLTSVSVVGTTPAAQGLMNMELAEGRFVQDPDIEASTRVVVLGYELHEDLFEGGQSGVGRDIRIKGQAFRVIGRLEESGAAGIFSTDAWAVSPWTATQSYLTGTNHFQEIDVEVESEEIIPRVKADIEQVLRQNHGITDPDKDDFHLVTADDAIATVGAITGIITALLGSVAAISLIVGGIGIMNIMLVSVSERTKEIGLRMAIGATGKDIRNQFLIEAIILTMLGGIIGIIAAIGLGILAAWGFSVALGTQWDYVFPFDAMIIGLVVSTLTGLVFGYFPARRAARMNPVDALRYE